MTLLPNTLRNLILSYCPLSELERWQQQQPNNAMFNDSNCRQMLQLSLQHEEEQLLLRYDRCREKMTPFAALIHVSAYLNRVGYGHYALLPYEVVIYLCIFTENVVLLRRHIKHFKGYVAKSRQYFDQCSQFWYYFATECSTLDVMAILLRLLPNISRSTLYSIKMTLALATLLLSSLNQKNDISEVDFIRGAMGETLGIAYKGEYYQIGRYVAELITAEDLVTILHQHHDDERIMEIALELADPDIVRLVARDGENITNDYYLGLYHKLLFNEKDRNMLIQLRLLLEKWQPSVPQQTITNLIQLCKIFLGEYDIIMQNTSRVFRNVVAQMIALAVGNLDPAIFSDHEENKSVHEDIDILSTIIYDTRVYQIGDSNLVKMTAWWRNHQLLLPLE